MIEQIMALLAGAAKRKESLPLQALLWTVDAQQHEIPSADELNEAIRHTAPFRIERQEGIVVLHPLAEGTGDAVTAADVEKALSAYQDTVKEITSRWKKRPTTPHTLRRIPRRK